MLLHSIKKKSSICSMSVVKRCLSYLAKVGGVGTLNSKFLPLLLQCVCQATRRFHRWPHFWCATWPELTFIRTRKSVLWTIWETSRCCVDWVTVHSLWCIGSSTTDTPVVDIWFVYSYTFSFQNSQRAPDSTATVVFLSFEVLPSLLLKSIGSNEISFRYTLE